MTNWHEYGFQYQVAMINSRELRINHVDASGCSIPQSTRTLSITVVLPLKLSIQKVRAVFGKVLTSTPTHYTTGQRGTLLHIKLEEKIW